MNTKQEYIRLSEYDHKRLKDGYSVWTRTSENRQVLITFEKAQFKTQEEIEHPVTGVLSPNETRLYEVTKQ